MSDVVSESNKELKKNVLQVPWNFDLNTTQNLSRGYLASMHGLALKRKNIKAGYEKADKNVDYKLNDEPSTDFYNPVEIKYAAIDYKGANKTMDDLQDKADNIDKAIEFLNSTAFTENSTIKLNIGLGLISLVPTQVSFAIFDTNLEIVYPKAISTNLSSETLYIAKHNIYDKDHEFVVKVEDVLGYIGTPKVSPSTIKPDESTDRNEEYFKSNILNLKQVFSKVFGDTLWEDTIKVRQDTFTIATDDGNITLNSLKDSKTKLDKKATTSLKELFAFLQSKKHEYLKEKDDTESAAEDGTISNNASFDYAYALLGHNLADINTDDFASTCLAFETYDSYTYDSSTKKHTAGKITNTATRWSKQNIPDAKKQQEETQKLLDIFDRSNKKVEDFSYYYEDFSFFHSGNVHDPEDQGYYTYIDIIAWKIPKILDHFPAWQVMEIISRAMFIGYEQKHHSAWSTIKDALKSAVIAFIFSGGNVYAAIVAGAATFLIAATNPPKWLQYALAVVILAAGSPTNAQIVLTSYSVLESVYQENLMDNYKKEMDKLNEQLRLREEDFAKAMSGKFGIELEGVSLDDHFTRVYDTNMVPPYVFPEVKDTYTHLLYE